VLADDVAYDYAFERERWFSLMVLELQVWF
jgi:hypothetical protein